MMADLEKKVDFSVPVPRIFYSFEHDGPFSLCTSCGASLLEPGTQYFIEKVFQGSEVVFEYAMCSPCRDKVQAEMSFESMLNVGLYMLENMRIEPRKKLIESFDNDVGPWLDNCIFKNISRKDCRRYQICAEFSGPIMLVSLLPLMVSEDAAEEMQDLLSKKTRESFGKFMRETVSPPSDFKDIPIFI